MNYHTEFTGFTGLKRLAMAIRSGEIRFAGNVSLKIYGRLNCGSGKRMKPGNRVFFQTEGYALKAGFRPCGHCLRSEYKQWKKELNTTQPVIAKS